MTFIWPSNLKWLPPEQNNIVFRYINYKIIEKTFFLWKLKNKLGNTTDLLTKHSKQGLLKYILTCFAVLRIWNDVMILIVNM